MNAEIFVDTNVVIYAVSRDPLEAAKNSIAICLLNREDVSTSGQVLQEFYAVATRKIKNPLSHEQAMGWLEFFADVPCVSTDLALVLRGADVSDKFKISYWDGAVIAAAERIGAKTLYTEDLNHGQHYGSVQVINPFKS